MLTILKRTLPNLLLLLERTAPQHRPPRTRPDHRPLLPPPPRCLQHHLQAMQQARRLEGRFGWRWLTQRTCTRTEIARKKGRKREKEREKERENVCVCGGAAGGHLWAWQHVFHMTAAICQPTTRERLAPFSVDWVTFG